MSAGLGGLTAEALRARVPEWRPWLALLEVTRDEVRSGDWGAAVPPCGDTVAGRPLLAGTTLHVDAGLARRWTRRLLGAAGLRTTVAPAALLEAGAALDTTRLAALAGVDAGRLAAVAPLAPVPWLQACAAALAGRIAGTRTRGWCPVCGAWPVLAEARGLERARRLRCGRCGTDWETQWLVCPFCGTDDHTRLAGLMDESAGETRRVEGCRACGGYVKTVTALTAADAHGVRLIDLDTVDLDLAALAHGFTRPATTGAPLDLRVRSRPTPPWWRRGTA